MPDPINPDEMQEALRRVYLRAATDEEFRQRCLAVASGPREALRSEGGVSLPPDAKVVFAEKREDVFVFLLPPKAPGAAAAAALPDAASLAMLCSCTITNGPSNNLA